MYKEKVIGFDKMTQGMLEALSEKMKVSQAGVIRYAIILVYTFYMASRVMPETWAELLALLKGIYGQKIDWPTPEAPEVD